jgi:hypothetical protein
MPYHIATSFDSDFIAIAQPRRAISTFVWCFSGVWILMFGVWPSLLISRNASSTFSSKKCPLVSAHVPWCPLLSHSIVPSNGVAKNPCYNGRMKNRMIVESCSRRREESHFRAVPSFFCPQGMTHFERKKGVGGTSFVKTDGF